MMAQFSVPPTTSMYYGPREMLDPKPPADPLWTEAQRLHFHWRKVRQDALNAFEECCADPDEVRLGLLITLIHDTYVARRAWIDAVRGTE